MAPRGLEDLTREQLAVLVPEVLLFGHLIDRAGMPHLLATFGLDGMRDIAIEEWKGASPHYTKRMQRALGYEDQGVETIFKGLQLDVGAPPQFLDFRFTLKDRWSGSFSWRTAVPCATWSRWGRSTSRRCATTSRTPRWTPPRWRPTRVPGCGPCTVHPGCPRTARRTANGSWIDESRDPIEWPNYTVEIGTTGAATFDGVTRIDPSEEGAAAYAGAIVSDIDFTAFSRSALVRIAEEDSLQWHLLVLSSVKAVATRTTPEQTSRITRRQFTGVAGLTAERLCRALGLGRDLDAVASVLSLHPAFQPQRYVGLRVAHDAEQVVVHLDRRSPAHGDRAWVSLLDPEHLEPLEAILHAVDPAWHAEVVSSDDETLSVKVVRGEPTEESSDVGLVRFSKGAAFEFEPRKSLPLTVV